MTSNADRMRQAHDQLVRDGAEPGMDFFVHHVTTADASSEFYALKEVDGELEAYYRDMGESSTILRSSNARAVPGEPARRHRPNRRRRPAVGELTVGDEPGRVPSGHSGRSGPSTNGELNTGT